MIQCFPFLNFYEKQIFILEKNKQQMTKPLYNMNIMYITSQESMH